MFNEIRASVAYSQASCSALFRAEVANYWRTLFFRRDGTSHDHARSLALTPLERGERRLPAPLEGACALTERHIARGPRERVRRLSKRIAPVSAPNWAG